MQLIHRLQSHHQSDCLSINWKWIFTLCCTFNDGSTSMDCNRTDERRLLSTIKERDDVYGSASVAKNQSIDQWCMQTSIPATEEERKLNWRDIEELDSQHEIDNEDLVTVAAEDFRERGEASKKDEEARSEDSDEIIKKFGVVVLSFKFEMMKNTLTIEISKVLSLPKFDGPSMYQLFVKIFNEKGKSLKKWHTPMFASDNHIFPQIMQYTDMSAKVIKQTAVRLRLYACERKRRDKLVSESIIGLESVNLHKEDKYFIRLEQREKVKVKSASDEAQHSLGGAQYQWMHRKLTTIKRVHLRSLFGSVADIPGQLPFRSQSPQLFTTSSSPYKENPFNRDVQDKDSFTESSKKVPVALEKQVGNQQELFVGLCYNQITGRLTIEIIKGNALRNPLAKVDDKFPSAFVKVTLCDMNGQELAKSKTTMRPNQANPLFKETFIFQVPQFQLGEMTIIIGVYHKKSANRKEIIGWSSVGMHSSSDNERTHWESMKDNKGIMSRHWHVLQDITKSRHGFPGAD